MIKLVSEVIPKESEIDSAISLRRMDDFELIKQCQDEIPRCFDAYRELVSRYESRVFETCLRLVADENAAERICEEAFIQVFHQIHQFQADDLQSCVRIWLFQIVYRLCQLHLDAGAAVPDSESGPKDQMARALARLDAEDRDWIVLRFVSELHVREIAEVLEVTRSEAREKVYQALSCFREACALIAA